MTNFQSKLDEYDKDIRKIEDKRRTVQNEVEKLQHKLTAAERELMKANGEIRECEDELKRLFEKKERTQHDFDNEKEREARRAKSS